MVKNVPLSLTQRRLLDLARMLPRTSEFDPVAALDDLDGAAKGSATAAAYHGKEGAWWKLWREVQRARGLDARAAMAELDRGQRRWFALWALESGDDEEGVTAYRSHLADASSGSVVLPQENVAYVNALLRLGRLDEAVATVDALADGGLDAPDEQAALAVGLVDARQSLEAVDRLQRVRVRYHDEGHVWAALAISLHAAGRSGDARSAATEAAKFHVDDRFHRLLVGPVVSAKDWNAWRSKFQPKDDRGEGWLAAPGAIVVPSSRRSGHSWGGKLWKTSPCRGCGHDIRVWFTIDLGDVPRVQLRLSRWRWFPLLGCVDCMVHMGRHDYAVDPEQRAVTLENVAIDCCKFGTPFETAPDIPEAPAALKWLKPISGQEAEEAGYHPTGFGKALVGGEPYWTQNPLRVWCPGCRGEMVYVAAMTTAEEFEPRITINNDSGFQYHFACGACRKLSVIAQWT